MGKTIYKVGSALTPQNNVGVNVIIHICNNGGFWNKGFVKSLTAKWADPERLYRQWYNQRAFLRGEQAFELGNIQIVPLDHVGYKPRTYVINMIAQDGIMLQNRNDAPLSYIALKNCLRKVYEFCSEERRKQIPMTVHMSIGMGSGLAGGCTDEVHKLVYEQITSGDSGFDTYMYNLPEDYNNGKYTKFFPKKDDVVEDSKRDE